MPEYVRSLVVVLVIATAVFSLLRPGFAALMPPGAYQRRRNAFLALTACAFLAPGFWFYALPAALVVLLAARRETNVPALFLALLLAVPPAAERIPGLGLVNFLLAIDHPRLLALLLLLPATVALRHHARRGRTLWPDRLLLAFILLQGVLILWRSGSFTNGLRGVVYLLIDVALPYYVASRGLATLAQLKDTLAAFCVSGAVLAAIGLFESIKHWLLYRALLDRWDPEFGMGNYLVREGLIRATATTGQPIVLGYVLMVALVCFLALRGQLRTGMQKRVGLLLLVAGLVATYSRGPWLGAAVAALGFWATSSASRMYWGLAMAAAAATAIAVDAQLPFLPMVANVDPATVDYRAELLAKSLEVLKEDPWFGSDRYVGQLAEMGMVQGQGIVDIVNTYVGVALSTGIVGLTLLTCLFTTVLLALWKLRRKYLSTGVQGFDNNAAGSLQAASAPSSFRESAFSYSIAARMLLASLLGILVTIGTVSSISVIPWVYWAWTGMGVACMRIAANNKNESSPPP